MYAQPGALAEVDAFETAVAKIAAQVPTLVVTRGAEGSTIYHNAAGGAPLHIPTASISAVVDPTGAGDAYLGGLVFGLARGFSLETTGRVAALAAAYAIEHRGCQEHRYSIEEFVERYTGAFGASAEIEALRTEVAP